MCVCLQTPLMLCVLCVCVRVCVGVGVCRFAKNLSPDKINLSTLKGEGQLTNLELDEEVLQSLLDLPTWLAINRVGCNKATIRVTHTHTHRTMPPSG